ncbi:hypothetical protein JCM15908A_11240 [Prevotella dentasini JCM 15908]
MEVGISFVFVIYIEIVGYSGSGLCPYLSIIRPVVGTDRVSVRMRVLSFPYLFFVFGQTRGLSLQVFVGIWL